MKLLVAAGAATTSSDDVPASVRDLLDSAESILVMAPSLPSRLDWLASATDKARQHADARLDRVLGQLDDIEADVERAGTGSDEPLLAFEQAIAEFGPDHVLISMRAESRADWQERGLIDELLARFDLPLPIFTVGD